MTSKYAKLAQRLVARQDQGRLDWKETETEGLFQVSFPDYSIRIHLQENRYGIDYVFVSIYNDEGTELDTFTSIALQDEWPDANEQLVQLYQSARRAALKVDKAIDSLLRELGD
jgi:hypothetical protein